MSHRARMLQQPGTGRMDNGRTLALGRRAAAEARGRHKDRLQWWLSAVYAGIVIGVLGVAIYLVLPARIEESNAQAPGQFVSIEADMAGFSQPRIEAKVGQPLTIKLRSVDTSFHTDGGGKHQLAIDEFGVNIIAEPKGTSQVTFTPTKAGTYPFYCDICCGGKANPTMQGELVVAA